MVLVVLLYLAFLGAVAVLVSGVSGSFFEHVLFQLLALPFRCGSVTVVAVVALTCRWSRLVITLGACRITEGSVTVLAISFLIDHRLAFTCR